MVGRTVDQVIAELPPERRARIGARYQEPKQEVEGLRELAGKAQADVEVALRIKQPSTSKIGKQADMHLSTLKSYAEGCRRQAGTGRATAQPAGTAPGSMRFVRN